MLRYGRANGNLKDAHLLLFGFEILSHWTQKNDAGNESSTVWEFRRKHNALPRINTMASGDTALDTEADSPPPIPRHKTEHHALGVLGGNCLIPRMGL